MPEYATAIICPHGNMWETYLHLNSFLSLLLNYKMQLQGQVLWTGGEICTIRFALWDFLENLYNYMDMASQIGIKTRCTMGSYVVLPPAVAWGKTHSTINQDSFVWWTTLTITGNCNRTPLRLGETSPLAWGSWIRERLQPLCSQHWGRLPSHRRTWFCPRRVVDGPSRWVTPERRHTERS